MTVLRIRLRPGPLAAVVLWAALVLAGHRLGAGLEARDPRVHVGAPPLVGMFDAVAGWRLLPAVVLAIAVVAWGPALAARARFGALLAGSWLASLAWMVSLAASDGLRALATPLTSRFEYLAVVPRIDGAGSFLRGFTDHLSTYPTHVKGHPPGLPLALWALDRAGLGGRWPATALVLCAGALVVPAVLVTLRELCGAATARGAASFLVLAPGAVWMATSADALFAGTFAAGVALFALATGRSGTRGDLLALAAGLALGATLGMSYGAVPAGAIVLAVALARRRIRPLLLAAAGVAIVLGAFAALGFWWPDGLQATRDLALRGVLSRRPYTGFLVISFAAFALAAGPAAAAGLARLRTAPARVVVAGALAGLIAADLSGLSRGETERIWLPFLPWVLAGTAGLGRGWLAGQAALGLALQVAVRSPW